ncbi:CRP-like cAMP-binding protein/Fe-S-cluster-containing hydrogenase component 2/thioredoxin reductase [Polymorphobacter multimanifer]|uniref:CRP-like cAMP-binding protein/Fe-S-cluster-containing hydrogenase component 2/thioredoxin reductase n=1 Tax=Polymorphobacter multimanifer TaxID=1070431 RepID=A0A841L6G7_9SPHN|nr:cyclic nucleotide-binding domain-containing protein [Polymorphobacter multimanifer]MBB6227141.1 CRP-like cAMP-binding protein/Fe-S-cluster-containing hydrogenase component 2/thioredoxin reductase [Polymorphobacter multimanifer]
MSDCYRIAIIGSGPAGLSAAARAAALGLSHVLLEKTDHLSDTIYKYQKGKHVMATPSQLVLRSDLAFDAGKRETVLGLWDNQTADHKVNVRRHAEIKSIVGTGDPIPGSIMKTVTRKRDGTSEIKEMQRLAPPYKLTLADGSEVMAETVVLAIGTQGNPNLMGCPGGNLPHVQYQLDDPAMYNDEHIFVIGGGDAGIENALGLAGDAAQGNVVTLVNRGGEFSTAKDANVKALMAARDAGRISIMLGTTTRSIEPGWIVLETADGEVRARCDRIIARMGSAPPRGFVEACGVEFASNDRLAFPKLSAVFESTAPGIFVIGALAGYPLIKHCMNQGHDVVEFINGNTSLKPADEPILEAKFAGLPGGRSVADWLELLRSNVGILNGMSPLQMREFMLDSQARAYRAGDVIFERNAPGSSLFGIAEGQVLVEVNPNDPSITVGLGKGEIFGEVGLISGRKRGATIRAGTDCILVEISRTAALKLMSAVPSASREVTRVTTERSLLQIFKSGLTPADLKDAVAAAKVETMKAGQALIKEGEEGDDIFIIRSGSMVVEKAIGGKPVFLSYVPAGSYVGEMAVIDGGRRTATVRAAVKSDVIRIPGEAFRPLLAAKPGLTARLREEMSSRTQLNSYIESKKDSFEGVVDMYTGVANFLVDNGVGEATDVLLIDETLCIGCDNCEKACADSHDGLSRLDREAGRTYAHLHVPTSCRHCEHPHCMADCPPNAIHRGPTGEVYIDDTCIGCGNCQRNCPYGVIRMDKVPPKRPWLISWMLFGQGPGPGEPGLKWKKKHADPEAPKKAIKCDMCSGQSGGPACVRACPTGAAIRVNPEQFLSVALLDRKGG